MVLRSILVDLQSYKSILYSFNLLYNVFGQYSVIALLLLFIIFRFWAQCFQNMLFFQSLHLRSAILVLLDAGVSKKLGSPVPVKVMKLFLCQIKVALFDDRCSSFGANFPANDNSIKPVMLFASKPIRCLSSSLFAWSRKKLAKSRISSFRSFRSGIRRVNSLIR